MQYRLFAILALAALLALPGSGAAPRITLSLTQVTLTEASDALSKATGTKIVVEPFPGQPLPDHLTTQQANFDWRQATLSEALRELTARFEVLAGTTSEGHLRLMPFPGRTPGPAPQAVGVANKRGLRLSVHSIEVSSKHALSLEGEPGQAPSGATSIALSCRSESLDRVAIASLENVIAKDDMGNLLVPFSPLRSAPVRSIYPDETFLRTRLTAPHPRATKLAWLEGEIAVYQLLEAANLVFPFPPKAGSKPVTDGKVSGEVLSFTTTEMPELRARIRYPIDGVLEASGSSLSHGVFPELIGASGKSYLCNRSSGGGDLDPDRYVLTGTYGFPPIPEPVTSARFRLVLKGDRQHYLRIRMTNIPLPTQFPEEKLILRDSPPIPEAAPNTTHFLRPLGLKLKGVTAAEAAAALTKAAGLLVATRDSEPPTAKEEYDWSQMTAIQALHDLRDRFDFAAAPDFTGRLILDHSFEVQPPLVPARSIAYTQAGIRVSVHRIHQGESRQQTFEYPTQAHSHRHTTVTLGVSTGPLEPNRLAGVANLIGEDDRGVRLDCTAAGITRAMHGYSWLPDDRRAQFTLTNPHPDAQTIKRLEGDLITYRDVETLRFAFPTPLTESHSQGRAAGCSIEAWGNVPLRGGKQLFGRLRITPTDPKSIITGAVLVPVGESGKRYGPVTSLGSGLGGNSAVVELNVDYPEISEPIDRVEVVALRQSEPERLFRFRLENLPLAGEPAFQAITKLPAEAASAGPKHPWLDPKGGHLLFRVRLAGRPAPAGTLRIGMVVTGGPVRWFETAVDEIGVAKIESVRVGTYRLLQTYRPNKEPQLKPRGRWMNAESQVVVKSKKWITAPELSWVAR